MVPVAAVLNAIPNENSKSVDFALAKGNNDDETLPPLVPANDSSSSNSEHGPRISWRNERNVTNARATAAMSRAASHAVTHARTVVPKPPLPVKAARVIQHCAHSSTHCVDGQLPLQRPQSSEEPADQDRPSNRSHEKHVRFGNVEMRNYEVVLGDHPDCSCGPPVSIGWGFSCTQPISVDKYESLKPRRRSMDELELNYFVRKRTLRRLSGVSDDEMHDAIDQVRLIQKHRRHTKRMQPMYKLQEAGISLADQVTKTARLRKKTA